MSEKSNPPRKRRVGNPALTGDAMNLEPGDNTRAILDIMEIDDFPPLDMQDAAAIEERCNEYFRRCAERDFKPLVSGLAGALGMNRRLLWAVVHDADINGRGTMPNICRAGVIAIKKAYTHLERLMEFYMNNGKINPVSGIFLSKNNFGYSDKVEYVVTPGSGQPELSAEDIASRYLSDSQTPSLPDSAPTED